MGDPGEQKSLPLTQHHVQSLVRYANAMDGSATRRWGELVTSPHTQEVRALALRISEFATEGKGAFTKHDIRLLTDVGDGLVKSAVGLIADPNVVPDEKDQAQFRLALGSDVLAVRDRVRLYVRA